jgi:Rrf2 family protein
MRISAKGRYALAAAIKLAEAAKTNELLSVQRISDELGISKIYLEQIFSALRHNNILTSEKGTGGGYRLTATPENTTAYDILSVTETILFDQADIIIRDKSPEIDTAIMSLVFNPLDDTIKNTLTAISVADLYQESAKNRGEGDYMFYI